MTHKALYPDCEGGQGKYIGPALIRLVLYSLFTLFGELYEYLKPTTKKFLFIITVTLHYSGHDITWVGGRTNYYKIL